MSYCKTPSKSSSKNNQDAHFPICPSEINTCLFSPLESKDQLSNTDIFEQIHVPNIEHELNVATSLLQQGSFTTGDNLFDHLADIIKIVVKEKPENIVDYFEELSFNVREQKFRMPENFPWTYFKEIDVERAKTFMKLMNLPPKPNDNEYDVCKENPPRHFKKSSKPTQKKDHPSLVILQRKLSLNENVLRLHLYWSLCGFNLSNEEVSKLSYALQKVQYHPIVEHARFWGKIYGLKKSYYIVEAKLTQSEIDNRFEEMREDVMEKIRIYQDTKTQSVNKIEDQDLIPGAQWQDRTVDELEKMNHQCEEVPVLTNNPTFDIPPEPIGTGLNRKTYFVVNCLNDEWIELPIVSTQQIQISRKIKKFLKGELDAEIHSYPSFPGTEKHYLRTMIARITSGTYVAPNNYYRRLTKTEMLEIYGDSTKETEGEIDESDGEGEEEDLDNDAIIIENENYKPCAEKLMNSKSWVHVRPNILEQGRIVYFDEKKALKALESGSYNNEEEMEEIDVEVGEEESDSDDSSKMEKSDRPALFNTCFQDKNRENVKSWSIRNSSNHCKINQLTILRSNLWPGAYSFTFEKYSDSIYFGWGSKYTARNVSLAHIPPIHVEYETSDLIEVRDPTVEMEEAWRLFNEKKAFEEMIEEENEEEEESC
ncbi:radial spoke head protein 6 homolog A [Eupeodes corollae]|uniref:radial spoke head protein 6 homolog A n=1 Tax=Eupeodes corollae TaxID=290404 RepID=UPI002490C1E6|nr:radial spoke head protein 6 homolog A [Eupeodes corollae]